MAKNVEVSDHDHQCGNCGEVLQGMYCWNCGQKDSHYERSVFKVMGDFFKELFDVDARVFTTLSTLLFKPGTLSLQFRQNKRAKYVAPIRLYLFSSLVLFFLFAITSTRAPLLSGFEDPDPVGLGSNIEIAQSQPSDLDDTVIDSFSTTNNTNNEVSNMVQQTDVLGSGESELSDSVVEDNSESLQVLQESNAWASLSEEELQLFSAESLLEIETERSWLETLLYRAGSYQNKYKVTFDKVQDLFESYPTEEPLSSDPNYIIVSQFKDILNDMTLGYGVDQQWSQLVNLVDRKHTIWLIVKNIKEITGDSLTAARAEMVLVRPGNISGKQLVRWFGLDWVASVREEGGDVTELKPVVQLVVGIAHDWQSLVRETIENLPIMMFVLLPLFVLLLATMTLGKGIRVVYQLIFAMHTHALAFIVLIFGVSVGWFVTDNLVALSIVWSSVTLFILAHTYIAFKKFYGSNHLVTILRFLVVMIFYLILLLIGLVALVLITSISQLG